VDDEARIKLFEDVYRRKYRNNLPGLKTLIAALEIEAEDSVVIVQQGFEGGQATGQVTNEASIRLRAALNIEQELDPDPDLDGPDSTRYADFSRSALES
jgi:hypothetical protein